MQQYDPALRVFAALGTTLLVIVLTCVPPKSNDFWLQARIGQLILDTQAVPDTLLFPFTEARNAPFNAHEWLPSVVFHLLDRFLGEDLLLLVLGFFGLLFFMLSTRLVWRLTHSLAASLLVGVGGIAVANFRHLLRPELVALTLLPLLVCVLLAYRETHRGRNLFWTLPIALVWANSHGSFLLGPFVAGLFAVGEGIGAFIACRRSGTRAALGEVATVSLPYCVAAFGMVIVSLLNPLGVHLFDFVWSLSRSDVTKALIVEWTPTLSAQFMATPAFAMFAVWMGLSAVLCVFRWRRLRPTEILLLVAFAVLALQRNRFVVFFGFASLPFWAQAIGSSLRPEVERGLLAAVGILCLFGLTLALRFGNFYGAYPYFAASNYLSYPMRAVIADPDLNGNVFNSYELGSELIYRAWPRLKPSIDSRIDSYGDDYFLDQNRMLADEKRLSAFIDRYDVRYMLLLWRDFESVKDMPFLLQTGWKMRYADHKMVLLQQAGGSSRLPSN